MKAVGLLVLALIVGSCPGRAQTRPDVALLGDSFAIGLAPAFKAKVERTAIGASVQHHWDDIPGIDRQTQVVIVLGTNDSLDYGLENSSVYAHQVARIASKLVQRGREVLWVGPPCILPGHSALLDSRVRDIDLLQHETLTRLALPTLRHISLRSMTERDGECTADNRAPDQVHFTPRGYETIARFIRSHLTHYP
jgi:hypothetical protein